MSDGINSHEVQGTIITWSGQPTLIGPKCNEDAGRWFCGAHQEIFPNNSMFQSHNEKGKPTDHLAVWICFTHGPEIP